MRIGVDVGGTNTDAVLMDGETVVASIKTPTTEKVENGIVAAITSVVTTGGIDTRDISVVCIGTTHFTNAFVQRRGLDRVGVLRIALPAARALPPLSDWPMDIAEQIGGDTVMVQGGYQFDGRINAPLDELAVMEAAKQFKKRNLNAVSISGLFAPVNDAMELRASEIIQNEHPECKISRSSQIGRIGLLERENAGVMNASLSTLAHETITGFKGALKTLGITAPFYVSQNDGTLMSAGFVEKYPVLTFASGPTNSMRGAAYLSGLKDAIVADIGGTTTDIGVLNGGFPRESSVLVDIGGVRTNFRMPDVLAIGLGGGSYVKYDGGSVSVGPRSVGYKIDSEALVFGGNTVTATDIAIAAGHTSFGDRAKLATLSSQQVSSAVDEMHRIVEDGIDRMKTSAGDAPLVLVGGGAILINRDLKGVSEIHTHEHAGVANAIGASIALIGGEVDKVFSYEDLGRDAAIEQAIKEATQRAVTAGADENSTEVTDIEELPLAYVPGGSVRLRVKVAGSLLLKEKHAA